MYVEPVKGAVSAKTSQVVQIETQEIPSEKAKQDAKPWTGQKTNENTTNDEMVANLTASQTEELKKALEKLNEQLPHSEARFSIHEKTNRVMIKLVDKDTQEVVKEIPPEKTLDIIARCKELAGVLIDENL